MRRTLLIIAFILVALIGGTGIWGLTLPADHEVASRITVPAPPESVYNTIRDIKSLPVWWKEAESVAPVVSQDGWERWSERSGGMAMTIIIRQEDPPYHLVTEIDTTGHPPVGGTWSYDTKLAPGGGTEVTVTEHGHLSNPYFRVMMRLGGPWSSIDSYLTALGHRFGKDVTPAHVVP